jgi:hypothetical protein
MKLLPEEPTPEMVHEANYAYTDVQDMGELEFDSMMHVIKAAIKAAPEVEQEPVGEVYEQQHDGSYRAEMVVELPVGTKIYTRPQPKRELFTVTMHEVREAMMYCEINHCDDPDAYTFDILKRLGIGVTE